MCCAQFVTDVTVFSFQTASAVVLRVGKLRTLNIQIMMELGRNIPPQLFGKHVGRWSQSLGVWFSGEYRDAGLRVELDDLKGL